MIDNIQDIKDENYLQNDQNNYKILRTSASYGLTADLGVRIDL